MLPTAILQMLSKILTEIPESELITRDLVGEGGQMPEARKSFLETVGYRNTTCGRFRLGSRPYRYPYGKGRGFPYL